MTPRATALLAVPALLVLPACGGGSADAPAPAAVTTTTSTAPTPSATDEPTDDATDDSTASPTASPARPAMDQCVRIPTAENGRYKVFEAGTAVVRRNGNRLELGKVTAANNWTTRVEQDDRDEVEVEFRRSARNTLDLKVEIDNGRLDIEICADNDTD